MHFWFRFTLSLWERALFCYCCFVKHLDTDYIVIGSGIAGLRAALDLAEVGRVTIFTKAQITESNSMYAQGGIAAAIGTDDSVDNHYRDTTSAGSGLCDAAAVRVLVEEGPKEIERLLEWDAPFVYEEISGYCYAKQAILPITVNSLRLSARLRLTTV